MADRRDSDPATLGDIRATREELRYVEQRLDQKIEKVAVNVARMRGELHEVKAKMVIKDDLKRVNQFVDWAWEKMETHSRESATTPRTLDEHGRQLREHEARLNRLENR